MMIDTLVANILPEDERVYKPKEIYYIQNGLKIKSPINGLHLTFVDGGVVVDELLASTGMDPREYQALAFGLSLDRFVMFIKGITERQVLASRDERILEQMRNLNEYEKVSRFPSIVRDISVPIQAGISEEQLSLFLRFNLPDEVLYFIESASIAGITSYSDLPESAIQRMNMKDSEVNVLVRLTIRAMDRTLTKKEANQVRAIVAERLNHLSLEQASQFNVLLGEL